MSFKWASWRRQLRMGLQIYRLEQAHWEDLIEWTYRGTRGRLQRWFSGLCWKPRPPEPWAQRRLVVVVLQSSVNCTSMQVQTDDELTSSEHFGRFIVLLWWWSWLLEVMLTFKIYFDVVVGLGYRTRSSSAFQLPPLRLYNSFNSNPSTQQHFTRRVLGPLLYLFVYIQWPPSWCEKLYT